MDQYVYVIYDPLEEKVICVHDEKDMDCEICLDLRKERIGKSYNMSYTYNLIESSHPIKKNIDKIRDEKIENILK